MNDVKDPDEIHEEKLLWLIERYEKELLRLCCIYLRDISLAEDAVQETFLKAYRGLGSFRGESSERTWLIRIAINVCKDMRRSSWFRLMDRRTNYERLEIPQDVQNGTGCSLMTEIMRLPRKNMEVVLLYYYEDLKLSEIAQMLGVSETMISRRLKKARDMLRETLEGVS